MHGLLSDLRQASRTLARQPGVLVFVVVTLALAIGINVAIFAVVESILLRPLPFDDPERLVRIWASKPSEHREQDNASPADFLDWQSASDAFSGMAFFRDTPVTLMGRGEPVEVEAEEVSANFFSVLGLRPMLGRAFRRDEGREQVAILSHDLWRARWSADRAVVGSAVTINRQPYTVVGVMPPRFSVLGRDVSLWIPQAYEPGQFRQRRYLEVVARLRPGVSAGRAQGRMHAIAARLEQEYPRTNMGWGVTVVPLHEQVVQEAKRPLAVIMTATVLVLLIACANVAALLLARATRREREMAVRSALGATRTRLARQLLVESLLLALLASVLGFLGVRWGLGALLALEPGDLPRVREVVVDPPVLAFATGLSLLAVALFGLAPAVGGSRSAVASYLKAAESRTGQRPLHRMTLRSLTVVEIALAVILLTGAGLLLRSFVRLRSVEPGFATDNVLVGRISLDKGSYPEDAQVVAYFERLLERLRHLSGVRSAAAVTALPLDSAGIDFEIPYETEAQAGRTAESQPQVAFRVVTPGYFATAGIPLLAGRDVSPADREDTSKVVVVNRRMAREAWPGTSAVGQRLGIFSSSARDFEVVGIVGDTRHYGLDAEPKPEIFVPQTQHPWYSSFRVVVRTIPAARVLASSVRREVLAIDPTQPIADLVTMEDVLAGSLARDRFLMVLLSGMAALAFLLALTGTYAVLTYVVSQRTRELGIRMALGAPRPRVLGLVLAEGGALAVLGLALGLLGAAYLTRLLGAFLFEVRPGDAATYASVAALLLATTLLACYLPAHRAASVDPLEALRHE